MTITSAQDKKLIRSAVRVGKHKSEAEAVRAALRQYIERQKQIQAAIDVMGTIDFDPEYDYKAARKRDGVGFD